MAAISHLLLFDSGGIIIGIAVVLFVSVMILLMWGWREFRRYLRAVKAIRHILQQPFREHSSTCSDVVLLPDSAPRNDDDSAVVYGKTLSVARPVETDAPACRNPHVLIDNIPTDVSSFAHRYAWEKERMLNHSSFFDPNVRK